MELLLWMWFYDSRWFFNFKIRIKYYIYIWFLPLIIHLLITVSCLYFLSAIETPECEPTLKHWLFQRTFFSLIISIIIIIFIIKVKNEYIKENSYFSNAKKIYPTLEANLYHYDYWIRRKSLISTSGIILLLLSIISLYWSYIMISLYLIQNKFQGCSHDVLILLNCNSFFVFTGNMPLLLAMIFMSLIKLTSFISAYVCPRWMIYLSVKWPSKSIVRDYFINI